MVSKNYQQFPVVNLTLLLSTMCAVLCYVLLCKIRKQNKSKGAVTNVLSWRFKCRFQGGDQEYGNLCIDEVESILRERKAEEQDPHLNNQVNKTQQGERLSGRGIYKINWPSRDKRLL